MGQFVGLFCGFLCFWCIFSRLFWVISTSATDFLERLVSKMTYYVSSRTSKFTHSLTHCLLWLNRPFSTPAAAPVSEAPPTRAHKQPEVVRDRSPRRPSRDPFQTSSSETVSNCFSNKLSLLEKYFLNVEGRLRDRYT